MSALKRSFREKNSVVNEINLDQLLSDPNSFELVDPLKVLNALRNQNFSQMASIHRAFKKCRPDLIKDSDLKKLKSWIAFQCHQISQLPKAFFQQAPYLTPLGVSFASLAYTSENLEYKSESWLQKHIQFFHILELASLPHELKLDTERDLLSQMTPEILSAILSGQSWVFDNHYIFIRRQTDWPGEFQPSRTSIDYLIYNREDWDKLLAKRGIETSSEEKSAACLLREDGLCWNHSPQANTKNIRWSIGLLFCLTLGVISFCVIQIIKMIRSQKHEEARKRFALQALTHELRSPISSLVISSEQVMNQFDKLHSSSKEAFLRMFDDIQRLVRVAESSRHYLSAGHSKEIIQFHYTKILSVNDFVASALDRYQDEIVLIKLDTDQAFTLDPYWVAVCLQNLVQNSLQHGQAPVIVDVKKEASFLIFSVRDSGQVSELDKARLFKPFYKSSASTGLGLGLSIVQTVSKTMQAELKVSFDPTCFQLKLEEPT